MKKKPENLVEKQLEIVYEKKNFIRAKDEKGFRINFPKCDLVRVQGNFLLTSLNFYIEKKRNMKNNNYKYQERKHLRIY